MNQHMRLLAFGYIKEHVVDAGNLLISVTTYSVAGTTTTDGLNTPAPFIGLLSDSPSITSLVFFADHDALVLDETTLGTLSRFSPPRRFRTLHLGDDAARLR